MPELVRVSAPAKVNLRLRVLAREESGYHSLETIFLAVSLTDEISIEREAGGVEIEVSGGIDTGPPERNLVRLAAEAFRRRFRVEEGVSIRLHKRIPAAAGLGGGSSDAAAVLRGLTKLFAERSPDPSSLLGIGAELGSDVPFFLSPTPFALAWGRGERLLSLTPPPARPILIASPGVAIPTGQAFQRFAATRNTSAERAAVLEAARLVDWGYLAGLAVNDLFEPALEPAPALREGDRILRQGGASLALLSGSGASIYGIFPHGADLEPVAEALTAAGFRCWLGETLTSWPEPPAGAAT